MLGVAASLVVRDRETVGVAAVLELPERVGYCVPLPVGACVCVPAPEDVTEPVDENVFVRVWDSEAVPEELRDAVEVGVRVDEGVADPLRLPEGD